jgi:IS5 family transposase
LTCPAGPSTTWKQPVVNGTQFIFKEKDCAGCPLRERCLSTPTTKRRSVVKNDYEAEYRAAQAKAKTAAYAFVRKEHPAIERKLAELVRWHDLRRARYRGLGRVLRQGLLTALVVNLKRMVRLLSDRISVVAGPATGAVRAGLGVSG